MQYIDIQQVENASGKPDARERSKMTHREVWGSLETRQDDMPRDTSSHLGGLPCHRCFTVQFHSHHLSSQKWHGFASNRCVSVASFGLGGCLSDQLIESVSLAADR